MYAGVNIDVNQTDDEASEAEFEQEGEEIAQHEEYNADVQMEAQGRVLTEQQFEANIMQQFGEEAASSGIQVVRDYYASRPQG